MPRNKLLLHVSTARVNSVPPVRNWTTCILSVLSARNEGSHASPAFKNLSKKSRYTKNIQKERNKKHTPQNTETNNAPPKPQRIPAKSRTEPSEGDRPIIPDPLLSSPQLNTPKTDLSLVFQEVKTVSPNPNQDKTKSQTICKYYKRGVCVGARGSTKCEFAHPKACKWYLMYGPGGCQRGGKCRFLHPKLCRDSLNAYKCYNLECKFYHLKGTERYEKRDTRPDYSRVPGQKNSREVSQEANRMDHLEKNFTDLQRRMMEVIHTVEDYRRHFPPLPRPQPVPTHTVPQNLHHPAQFLMHPQGC